MKTVTQQEIIQLVKDKKLSPHILKPYQEEVEKEEVDNEAKLCEAIYALISQLAKGDNSKEIIDAIQNMPVPEVKVENVMPKQDKKEEWIFDIERDDNNLIQTIKARQAK